ncbi:MAG: Gfo/Idh/MocA family oxidoreductase [Planctomycetes bacterium]|nr:Gfo/Idh/MocA family oxidoreductase [Planctomycetota bacterium]
MQTFTEYEDLLKADVDIIVVASGAPEHGQHVCMALDAGKHVLSEVPAEVSMKACEDIVRAVRRTGLKYMLAENCCYWGYIREYRKVVQSGRLGDVLYAEGEYLHSIPGLMYYNPTLGSNATIEEIAKHPDTKRTWRATLHPINYLTHDLGPLLDILDDRCVSVSCLSTPPAFGPDYAPAAEVAIFRTAKNRVIKMLCEFSLPRPAHHWFALMGTKGSLESPRGPATEHLLYVESENMPTWSRMAWDTRILGGPREAWASGHGGADWYISREFLDCILKDTPPPIDVYRAMDYTVPGVCAVQSAAHGGAAIQIPDLRSL